MTIILTSSECCCNLAHIVQLSYEKKTYKNLQAIAAIPLCQSWPTLSHPYRKSLANIDSNRWTEISSGNRILFHDNLSKVARKNFCHWFSILFLVINLAKRLAKFIHICQSVSCSRVTYFFLSQPNGKETNMKTGVIFNFHVGNWNTLQLKTNNKTYGLF